MRGPSVYGLWWLPDAPDRKVAGHLTWDGPRAPVLEVLDQRAEFWVNSDGFPMVLGEVSQHGYVTLLNCSPGGMTIDRTHRQRLVVGQALSGILLDRPDEPVFRRVEIELPVLAMVLGPKRFEPKPRPTSRSRYIRLPVDRQKLFFEQDGIGILLQYVWWAQEGRTRFEVELRPWVHLTSGRPMSAGRWLEDWV